MTSADRHRPIPLSKWRKHQLLLAVPALAAHLPETLPCTHAALTEMLHRHSCVIVKPELGEGGRYVAKICRTGADGGTIREGLRVVRRATRTGLLQSLPPWLAERRCVVQQYVRLAPKDGRPVDVRTIVQRNEQGRFEVTGTFIKIAPRKRFVTNVKQGGTIGRLLPYLRHVVGNATAARALHEDIYRISENIGDALGDHFDNHVYGIDLGVDTSGRVWIIEVNTEPNLRILGLLNTAMRDRALYLRRRNRKRQRRHIASARLVHPNEQGGDFDERAK